MCVGIVPGTLNPQCLGFIGGGGGGGVGQVSKKWVSIVCKNYPEGNLYTGLHEVLIREDATLEPLEDEYWLFYCTHE